MAAPNTFNHWIALTYSDAVDLVPGVPDSLYVGAAGNVVLMEQDGSVCTFLAVPAGTTLPVTPKRVMAATTVAAGSLIGLYQV